MHFHWLPRRKQEEIDEVVVCVVSSVWVKVQKVGTTEPRPIILTGISCRGELLDRCSTNIESTTRKGRIHTYDRFICAKGSVLVFSATAEGRHMQRVLLPRQFVRWFGFVCGCLRLPLRFSMNFVCVYRNRKIVDDSSPASVAVLVFC